jgi:hypothetical protein
LPKPEILTGSPDHDHSVARCFGPSGRQHWVRAAREAEGHGVTWKHVSGATLSNLKCPTHDGPLYQTTRVWRNSTWTVIPAEVVKKAAASKRAEKQVAIQRKLDAGTHKYARDLQPGDIIETAGRKLRGGKVVEVEKIGGKIRITISRTREAVVKGYLYHGTHKPGEVETRARLLEQLTDTTDVSGTTLCVVDVNLHRWAAWHPNKVDTFTGWAVEHAGSALAELWNNEVNRWTRFIETGPRPVVQGRYELDDHFDGRKQKEAAEWVASKAQADLCLQIALDRLVLHTGSAATSAEEVNSVDTYKIVRFFKDDRPKQTIETGLTREAAQAHCNDASTHGDGWFDGFEKEAPTSVEVSS